MEKRRTKGRGVVAMVVLISARPGVTSAAGPDGRAEPGIRCARDSAHSLSRSHEDQLAASLRTITGLAGLGFEADGSLSLGDEATPTVGSPQARRLLSDAMRSGMAFVIEDHSGSASVTFAQLDAGTLVIDDNVRLTRWRVRLDFTDFRQVEAPADVRQAFDVGFGLLHELLHGLGYADASREEDVGTVEEKLNAARVEIGLPLRERYFGEAIPLSGNLLAVRLSFRAAPAPERRRPRRYLTFVMRRSH